MANEIDRIADTLFPLPDNGSPAGMMLFPDDKSRKPGAVDQVTPKQAEQYTAQSGIDSTIPSAIPATKVVNAADQRIPKDIPSAARARPTLTNIVKDYDWTLSINKEQLADTIPYIKLTEFKITASNVINSVYSTLMAFSDIVDENNKALKDTTIKDIKGQALDWITAEIDGKVSNYLGPNMKPSTLVDTAVSKSKEIKGIVGNYLTNNITRNTAQQFGPDSGNLFDLYGNLYARKETGREYVMPYFTQSFIEVSNTFNDSYEGFGKGLADRIQGIAESATAMSSIVQPGVYIQRPQFYNFKSTGAHLTVTFTLFNTITPMEHLRNSKLIQQLALNNLPRRYSRVVVEPPCVYEVLVPGKAFYPYCYIANLRVDHIGTKRIIEGEIIPDAYQVTITLNSLTTDVSNFYDVQMKRHGMDFTRSDETFTPSSTPNSPTNTTAPNTTPSTVSVVAPAQQQREAITQTTPPEVSDPEVSEIVQTPAGDISQPNAVAANIPSAPITQTQVASRGFTSYNIPGFGGF